MENNENKIEFEDISSSSKTTIKKAVEKTGKVVEKTGEIAKTTAKKVKKASDFYGTLNFENIDKVIKIISYVVSIGVFLIFLVAAALVYIIDHALIFLSAIILLAGAAIALIFLYLIFAQGLIISQNNEILKKLDK